ncbi:unnamed protein product [Effrenium voratum]|uniref:Protein kinase domain-containing protein n=1 Tax=Effrenium voratum TaxID=2562239 RepID=A0AA36I9V1_9DINO|nr:unnamed protein product [Effrenium voratum]
MKRCVDCLSPSDPGTLKRMYREIAVLRQVHHDNIIALTDVFLPHVGHDLFLFFQAASCDLEHAIRYNMLDELAQQSIGCDVIRALAYLHASDLIHRDLKPSNVLLDESGAKLCDFGLVRLIGLYPKGLTEYVGMRWYRAPELFLGSRCYNQSIDVWSYGCVVAEMALGRPLLAGIDSEEQLGLVVGLLGRPTELEAGEGQHVGVKHPASHRLAQFGPTGLAEGFVILFFLSSPLSLSLSLCRQSCQACRWKTCRVLPQSVERSVCASFQSTRSDAHRACGRNIRAEDG